MAEPTLRDHLRYRFDNLMARGAPALVAALAVLSAAIILAAGLLLAVTGIGPEGEPHLDLAEATWTSAMRTLDAGNLAGDLGWPFRLVMLGVTFAGIFVISALIGVLTTGLEERLEQLRKGRSHVIEKDHVVVLGWSEQVFAILSELVVANANQRSSCVVILGEHDRVEMEDAIRDKVPDTGRTRIVCRTGSPIEPADLALVGLAHCRAVIVLSPEEEDPDASVIKTLLAVLRAPDRRPEPYHVVAELRDPKNADVARLVGQGEVELVLVGDLVARVMAQTSRQSGLSIVYQELLDFDGAEIYFQSEPSLVGRVFGDVLQAYEDATVIGLHPAGGTPHLNPPGTTVIAAGDRLIVIAEDDDTAKLRTGPAPAVDEAAIRDRTASGSRPERTLLLGWSWRAPAVIRALDAYVPEGSEIVIVADHPDGEVEAATLGVRQRVTWRRGDTTDRTLLDALDVPAFDHALLLADADRLPAQRADARTLITLLHLRDLGDKAGRHVPVVSEMLDVRNRALAEVAKADDFIVSDRLVSLMLAQVAENKHLNAVFADLFDPDGSEIYLKPAGDYVRPDADVSFATIVEAARRRGELAIGWRIAGQAADAGKAWGVVVNPAKGARVRLGDGDKVIVLAEG